MIQWLLDLLGLEFKSDPNKINYYEDEYYTIKGQSAYYYKKYKEFYKKYHDLKESIENDKL